MARSGRSPEEKSSKQEADRQAGKAGGVAAGGDAPGITRRDFLVVSGVSSGAGLLIGQGAAIAAGPPAAKAVTLGPGEIPVPLLVNGTEHRVRVRPETTLVEVLRDQLGLTGTKIGCDRGACGACTVWIGREARSAAAINWQPMTSCMTLALDVAGLGGPGGVLPRPIVTIEGLAHKDVLHPVQEAFIEKDALQCGFCTPGMVMSCAALCEGRWADGKPLDEEDVREAVAGNLCRCGAYPNIIAATLQAHKSRPAGGRP